MAELHSDVSSPLLRSIVNFDRSFPASKTRERSWVAPTLIRTVNPGRSRTSRRLLFSFCNRNEIMRTKGTLPSALQSCQYRSSLFDMAVRADSRCIRTNGKPSLLLSYVHQELATHAASLTTSNGALESRVICEGEFFVALVPYWAGWPFESMILPKLSVPSSLFSL